MELEAQIENIALRLPELPKPPRKNLFQILGIQSKETLNSRILSYFLNPKEDHELEYLFFDSLKELYCAKSGKDLEFFTGDFEVKTEDTTSRVRSQSQKNKSIDISLDGRNWSIIIENKINYHLNNPLDTYWNHKQKDYQNLAGVILSLSPLSEDSCTTKKGVKYINITHAELVNRVQSNLNLGKGIGHVSLFYLNEYFKNIQSHYETKAEEKPMNEIVKALNKQGEEVIQIQEKVSKAVDFIDNQVLGIFENRGFEKNSYWYHHPEWKHNIRFWVNGGYDIILRNELRFVIESFGETDKIIRRTEKEFFDFLQIETKSNPFFIYGNKDGSRSRTHLVKYANENFLSDNDVFSNKFEQLLDEYFLNKGGIVDSIENYLNNVDCETILK